MKKIVIVTGGRVETSFTRETLKKYDPDVLIASDRGIMVLKELSLVPDYLVGDFDSGEEEVISVYKKMFVKEGKPIIRSFQPEKDETDTEIALSVAISLEPSEILLLGATGTRLDHTMANLGLLVRLLEKGIKGYVADEYNLICLHDEKICLNKRKTPYRYFSLLPFGQEVKALTIKGAKYEIEDFTLQRGSGLTVSNEFQKNEVTISWNEGALFLFQTSDEAVECPFC